MDASVIIAGAGPSGLTLAAELRLAGADVVVLESLLEPSGESRGLGFTTRTMEIFEQRGLLPRFGEIETSQLGHFGGLPLDFGVLGRSGRAAKTVPQSQTEAVLESWARECGADIRRGNRIVGLRDTGDAVEVDVESPAGTRRLRGAYLVGCDGGRSTVRKAAGFDFPGTEATMEMYLADVRGVNLEPRMIGDTVAGGMVMVGPLPDGATRLIVCEQGTPPRRRSEPPPFSEVAQAWKRLTGIDISDAEPLWVSAFGDATRQVTEYRRGRVLLAGDAAHIHLPAGGQGMNTGIQDAVNLGWKLAAVLRGTSPPSLLDTYHEERHPVGQRLLTNTRAQGLLLLGGEESSPLREILAELLDYEDVARHLAGMVSGVDIRYDVGEGRHQLLGARMPRLELSQGDRRTSTDKLLRSGRGLLLDLQDNPVLRRRAAPWTDQVDIVTAQAHDPEEQHSGASAFLIRPDGHVVWVAPGSHHDLPMALDRWFGPRNHFG